MKNTKSCVAVFVVGASALFGGMTLEAATAADAVGVWTTSDGEAHVKVSPCADQLCGQIVWLKEPIDLETGKPNTDKNNPDPEKRARPINGLQLFQSMKPTSVNSWKGKIYNPDDGKSYDATVTLEDQRLRVKGCALGGLICQSELWSR